MIDIKESERIINSFASKVMRRLAAAGATSLSMDDVKQEMWCAWCKARDNYDPETGVPFGAYLRRGLQMNINRYLETNVDRRHSEEIAVPLDQPVGSEADGPTLHEAIPGDNVDPIQMMSDKQQMNRVFSILKNPKSEQFIKILADQPKELLLQLRQLEARSKEGKSRNIVSPFSNRITTDMVFRLLNVSGPERGPIYRDIKRACEIVHGESN